MIKLRKHTAEYYWKQFKRIHQAQTYFPPNSKEFFELNKIAWKIVAKYTEALLKEMKK